MVELVVKISEELYRQVKDPCVEGGYIATECYNAIYRGIPLDRFLEAHNYRDKEQEEPCDNAISRKAAIEAFQMFREYESNRSNKEWVDRIETVLNQLPPVTPQPKTGHWIQTNEFFINQDGQFIYKFICSECKSLSYFRKSNKKAIGANVCPNCGAKMQEVEE